MELKLIERPRILKTELQLWYRTVVSSLYRWEIQRYRLFLTMCRKKLFNNVVMSKSGLHQHWCSSFLWVLMIFFLFYRAAVMGKGCIAATKYFLFLFNLLFFVSVHTPTPLFCLRRNSESCISSGLLLRVNI